MSSPQSASLSQPVKPATSFRWVICGLLLFATTVNYMDRQVISYLKEYFCRPLEQGGFGWSNSDYANVTGIFVLFYAGTSIFAGSIIDKVGTKIGLAAALVIWSLFGIANAFVGSAVMLHIVLRSLFGIGEAGNFPASIKTVAEWFPKRERALATGIFNSGSNIGAMISALFVPWCMAHFGNDSGWKMAYILTGVSGFVWLIFWFWLYDSPSKHKRLSASEFEYIHCDEDTHTQGSRGDGVAAKVGWFKLLTYRQTWSFFFGKFMTDGIWWFYLFWLPDFLMKQFGMTAQEVKIPTFVVYGVAIIGSIYGGAIPLSLIKKGMPVYKARMLAMMIIAAVPVLVLFTQFFGNVERFGNGAAILAIAIICLAAAAHQAWSANLFTTVSDMFPKKAVASVTGIGAAAGGLGGFTIQKLAGRLTDTFKDHPQSAYAIMFFICASSYLIAWGLMKVLVPQHKPIQDL